MGGGRRSRGGNSRHSDHSSSQHNPSSQRQGAAEVNANLDLNVALQDVDGDFQVTWREVVFMLAAVALMAVLSICVGVSAGMIISIQYYESQTPAIRNMDSRDTSFLYSGRSAYQKVTALDPSIASSNVMQRERNGLDLAKVVTTSASGELNVLMVVEEMTPLQHIEGSTGEAHRHAAGMPHHARTSSANIHGGMPMTMQQAKSLVPNYDKWKTNQPSFALLQEPTIRPTVCSDGETLGFDNWNTLKDAVQEANALSAQRFMQWSSYFATVGKSFSAFEDNLLYYDRDVVFTICPGATLRARRGPIFINAENVVIECDGCLVHVGGTHLAFGPHARNVLVRGLTFKGAHSSSLTFFHHGADASFEECTWTGHNSGLSRKFGAVADVNSTSNLNFYQCEIGYGGANFFGRGGTTASTSSLSLRS